MQEAWEVEISDAEWDDGATTDDETVAVEQNLPPPTYEDFEAALAGGGSSVKSKSKTKQGGSVSLNLKDIPKKPMGRPSLVGKPTARPGMQEAAQPLPPPPPPTLGTRPRPKDGFVEATIISKPPSSRVVAEPAPKKEAPPPPPPPPLMAAPTKPQAAVPPAVPPPPPAPVAQPKKEEPEVAPVSKPVAPVVAETKQEEQPLPIKAEEKAPSPTAAAAAAPVVPPAPEPTAAAAPESKPKPPRASTPATKQQPSSQSQYEAAIAPERALRRARSVQVALDLQASKSQIKVKVWQVNAAGVLVTNDEKEITGFIPLTELSQFHASAILKEERRIKASINDNNTSNPNTGTISDGSSSPTAPAVEVEGPGLRRAAMGVLRGQEFLVEVIAVDNESGRVIFSERAAAQTMSTQRLVVSPEGLAAAAEDVGSLINCRVRSIRPFGIFVDFPLKLENGKEEIAIGLVHSSEISWDNALPASVSGKSRKQAVPFAPAGDGGGASQVEEFTPGQVVTARLTHVDPKKARIFLSIRRATPNPLLETLDSLLANTGAGATLPGATLPGGPRQTLDAAVDMRPLLGDLEVAAKFAEAIVEVEGVVSATLGVRLESRASSPDVEVYMAKDTGEVASVSDSEDGNVFKLVLRQGRDVQEVGIKCVLERAELREVAAATVAKIGPQPQE